MNKFIVLIILAIIILPTIQAAPPTNPTTQVSSNSLQIESPAFSTVKLGTDRRFHAHVINETQTKTNLTTQCALHIYNQSGWDIDFGSQFMEFEDYNGIDFAKTVTAGNFSIGQWAYVIHCNSSKEVGFFRGQFEVNPTGAIYTTESSITFFGSMFLFVIIAFFFIVIGIYVENGIIKTILFSTGGILLFAAVLFTMVILDQTNSGFSNIIDGFATFLFILKILVGIFVIGLLIGVMVLSYNLWQVKRGFK